MQYDFDELSNILAPFRTIYFEPLWGNNGDVLIKMGALKFLNAIGKRITSSLSEAEAVVINGGAGMTTLWESTWILKKYLGAGINNVIVLPSTFYLPPDDMEDIRSTANANGVELVIFSREMTSFSRLSEVFKAGKDLFLSHDMAFFLNENDFNLEYGNPSHPYVLVVERRDREASTDILSCLPRPSALRKFVTETALGSLSTFAVRKLLRKRYESHHLKHTNFARECRDNLEKIGICDVSIIAADPSREDTYTFDEFFTMISHAENVITTRLHAAILRNILKKPCYLLPTGGDYKKNESVFENSLKGRGYVELLPAWDNSSTWFQARSMQDAPPAKRVLE